MNTANFTEICNKIYGTGEGKKQHSDIFPKNVFAIIAGSTGSGKTNLLMNFLFGGHLRYDKVMIYTTTEYQQVYKFLKDCDTSKKIVSFHNPADGGILDPSNLDKTKTHIIVFDDVMNEKDQKS